MRGKRGAVTVCFWVLKNMPLFEPYFLAVLFWELVSEWEPSLRCSIRSVLET
jgi:hypothetical protein